MPVYHKHGLSRVMVSRIYLRIGLELKKIQSYFKTIQNENKGKKKISEHAQASGFKKMFFCLRRLSSAIFHRYPVLDSVWSEIDRL